MNLKMTLAALAIGTALGSMGLQRLRLLDRDRRQGRQRYG